MRYFLIAGEASGDLHGAHLIRAIKAEDPSATFAFMGGNQMAYEAGDDLLSIIVRLPLWGLSQF